MINKKHILLGLFVCFLMSSFIIPIKANPTKEVEPFADAEVNEQFPDSNYGSSDYLHVGANLWGSQQESYLKFLIPTIETEITRVYIDSYWYSFMCKTPLSVSACMVSTSWNEYTITWNNKPAHGTHLDTDSVVYDGEHFIIDISLSIITEGMILSICIYENAPFKPDGLQAGSREGEYNVPVLIVEYETPPIIIIAPIIVGVIAVVVIGGVVYSKNKKKREIRQNLENSTHPKKFECSKCGTKIQSLDATFCTECGQKLK